MYNISYWVELIPVSAKNIALIPMRADPDLALIPVMRSSYSGEITFFSNILAPIPVIKNYHSSCSGPSD